MNSRGRGGYSFRGGSRGGGITGRGRGHSFQNGMGRSIPPPVKKIDDSDDDNNNNNTYMKKNVTAMKEQINTDRGKRPATSQTNHNVITTLTDKGTEVPKKLNNKVFIDGLPYESKSKLGSSSLEEELMQFATAWKVGKPIRLIKKDGQGFGFLVFHSPHSVDVAVRVLNGRKFLGRTLRVEVPKPKDSAELQADSEADAGKNSYARQVLLSDLAKIAQPEIIREILRDVAPQLEKRLESIKMTSRNRKAFLTFHAPEDVEPAVKFLDGFSMLGRRIQASRAAAPGSLPYSKVSSRVSNNDNFTEINAENNNNLHAKEGESNMKDYDETPILPLGVEVPQSAQLTTKQKQIQIKQKQLQEEEEKKKKALADVKRSNITGVTEKYNLLDNGPAEVYVGNLGEEVTEAQLRSHFAPCGTIASCEIIVNKSTRLPTGIARVVFTLPAYAAYAQRQLHGSRLRGHVLRVDRGEEASAPLASELPPAQAEEEIVDEEGYMAHYGVKDKAAYFRGTTLEEKRPREKADREEKEEGQGKVRKVRKTETNKEEKKKEKKEEENGGDFVVSASIPITGSKNNKKNNNNNNNDDDDEEEHFHDVDEVEVPVGAVKTGKQKKSDNKKKVMAKKAKKSSK